MVERPSVLFLILRWTYTGSEKSVVLRRQCISYLLPPNKWPQNLVASTIILYYLGQFLCIRDSVRAQQGWPVSALCLLGSQMENSKVGCWNHPKAHNSHIWSLMLAVSWGPSWGCGPGHTHVTLTPTWPGDQLLSVTPLRQRESRAELYAFTPWPWQDCGTLPTVFCWPRQSPRSALVRGEGTWTSPPNPALQMCRSYCLSVWDGLCIGSATSEEFNLLWVPPCTLALQWKWGVHYQH